MAAIFPALYCPFCFTFTSVIPLSIGNSYLSKYKKEVDNTLNIGTDSLNEIKQDLEQPFITDIKVIP